MHREQEGSVAVKKRSMLVFLSPVFGLQEFALLCDEKAQAQLYVDDQRHDGG
jgi:hypothetical protein